MSCRGKRSENREAEMWHPLYVLALTEDSPVVTGPAPSWDPVEWSGATHPPPPQIFPTADSAIPAGTGRAPSRADGASLLQGTALRPQPGRKACTHCSG